MQMLKKNKREERLPKIISFILWTVAVLRMLNGTFLAILQMLGKFPGMQYLNQNDLAASIATIVFLCLCAYLFRRKYIELLQRVPAGYFIFFTGIIVLNEVLLALIQEHIEAGYFITCGITLFMSLSVFSQMFMVFLLAASHQKNMEKQKWNETYLETQAKYYEYLIKREEETKKFRHDMRNHMRAIYDLAGQEGKDELRGYVERICGKFEMPESALTVGNATADAVINRFAEMFSQKKTEFFVSGHLPSDCFVDAFDLCTIFSNILENALEASEKCEEEFRRVKLQIRYDADMIFILEENYLAEEIQRKSGILKTSKQEKTGHGYGVQNVIESAKNYTGTVEYIQNGNCFQIFIVLYER